MQFSLKSLLITFACVAIACAGILYATRMWAAFFFSALLLLLLFSLVQVLIRIGAARAYWIGFTVFGGAYFLFSLFGDAQPYVNERGGVLSRSEPRLLTSELLIRVDNWANRIRPQRQTNVGAFAGHVYAHTPSSHTSINLTARGSLGHSLTIGHSTFSVLLALIGGWLGCWCFRRQERSSP